MNFFDKYKTIAVYGMSATPGKAANGVPMFFHNHGYNIIPINPRVEEISGLKAYKTLADVPDFIEVLNVFRPSEEAYSVVSEAVQRKQDKGDICAIWLQEGIFCDRAKTLALENGIEFYQDLCLYKEYFSVKD